MEAAKPKPAPAVPPSQSIVQKVVGVIREIGAIPKTGFNDFHKYKYRSHEDITNALQPALAKAGILIIPKAKQILFHQPGHIVIEATYEVTDGKDSISFIGIGEGADISKEGKPGDKAAYKAQTGAMKYALNDLLMLAGKDPEDEGAEGKKMKGPNPKAPAAVQVPAVAGKQAPAAQPKAMVGTHAPTLEQEARLTELMDGFGLNERQRSLRVQKAAALGYDKVIAELEAQSTPAAGK